MFLTISHAASKLLGDGWEVLGVSNMASPLSLVGGGEEMARPRPIENQGLGGTQHGVFARLDYICDTRGLLFKHELSAVLESSHIPLCTRSDPVDPVAGLRHGVVYGVGRLIPQFHAAALDLGAGPFPRLRRQEQHGPGTRQSTEQQSGCKARQLIDVVLVSVHLMVQAVFFVILHFSFS
jgi:hypothetical protein